MTRGYLLDTNIIEFWFNARRQEHEPVCTRISELPDASPLATSVIVVGEIEYGYQVGPRQRRPALSKVLDLVRTQIPRVLEIRRFTADAYGDLRARLFEKYAPRGKKGGLRPEQLTDPLTGKKLGIQENDLWIAAQALERNLVLVAHDQLKHIREVAPDLAVEDWASSGDPAHS